MLPGLRGQVNEVINEVMECEVLWGGGGGRGGRVRAALTLGVTEVRASQSPNTKQVRG